MRCWNLHKSKLRSGTKYFSVYTTISLSFPSIIFAYYEFEVIFNFKSCHMIVMSSKMESKQKEVFPFDGAAAKVPFYQLINVTL